MLIFEQTPLVHSLVIAAAPEFHSQIEDYAQQYGITKLTAIVPGGRERQDSIAAALLQAAESEIILVHDAVRPFITPAFVETLIQATIEHHAVVPGVTPKETIKEVFNSEASASAGVIADITHNTIELVRKTHQRSRLRLIQTPQGFKRELLAAAYTFAAERGFVGTDDASVVEFFGVQVRVVEGLEYNIKLTTPFDWAVAETILHQNA